jgi:hypothetical protein
MISRSCILKMTSTFPNEMIHVMSGCVMHLHGHQNKMVHLLKPSIFVDLSSDVKFCSCTCWLTNNTQSHYLLCWGSNHHIDNENLVLWIMKWSARNEIPNVKTYHRSFQTSCPFFKTRAYMTSRMTLCVAIHWPPNKQWAKCVLNLSNSCLIHVHTHKWKD